MSEKPIHGYNEDDNNKNNQHKPNQIEVMMKLFACITTQCKYQSTFSTSLYDLYATVDLASLLPGCFSLFFFFFFFIKYMMMTFMLNCSLGYNSFQYLSADMSIFSCIFCSSILVVCFYHFFFLLNAILLLTVWIASGFSSLPG